jgi:ABC-type dipeptide/oligopeptide/nickel transport system permease component
MIRALPGDPASALMEHMDSSLSIEAIRSEFKLDLPWTTALSEDLKNLLFKGDLGRSLHSRRPVTEELLPRTLKTLELTGFALLMGLSGGIALGLGAARKIPGFPTASALYTAIATALPAPWIGPMLAWAIGVQLEWTEPSGGLLLPSVMLAIGIAAFWARLIESRVREAFSSGSAGHPVRTARARGVPEWKVVLKYAFAPATPAFVAILGTQIGNMLAGSFVAEVLFDWPGLGSAFVDAVLRRDYPMVEACVCFSGAAAILGTRLGDFLQAILDPRVRSSGHDSTPERPA